VPGRGGFGTHLRGARQWRQNIRPTGQDSKFCRSTSACGCSLLCPWGESGLVADGEIVVLPVNHVLDGQDPVFLTARGSKLSAAEQQNVAAFEADHFDEQTRTGWSVLITGHAEVIYEEAEIQRLSRYGLQPWPHATEPPVWMRIRALSVTGRRLPGDFDPQLRVRRTR
jgi:uncharacterized protein